MAGRARSERLNPGTRRKLTCVNAPRHVGCYHPFKKGKKMPTALIAKLERFARLSQDDKAALRRLASLNVRNLGPHEDVIREGDKPVELNLVLSGWACRHKHLED